jgi:hypothetical protein
MVLVTWEVMGARWGKVEKGDKWQKGGNFLQQYSYTDCINNYGHM